MDHVVFFSRPDGSPAFRRFPSLEEGARFVEHLRNVEDINDGGLFALTAVPLSFKTWYRVEVGGSPDETAPDADAAAVADADPVAVVEAPAPSPKPEAQTSTVVPIPEPQVAMMVPAALPQDAESAEWPELAQVGGGRHERGLGFFAR